jgi:hypothetical protein
VVPQPERKHAPGLYLLLRVMGGSLDETSLMAQRCAIAPASTAPERSTGGPLNRAPLCPQADRECAGREWNALLGPISDIVPKRP